MPIFFPAHFRLKFHLAWKFWQLSKTEVIHPSLILIPTPWFFPFSRGIYVFFWKMELFSSFRNTAVKNLCDIFASAGSRFNKLLLTNSWNQSCPITVIHWDLCQRLQWRNGINIHQEFSILLKSSNHFVHEGEKSVFKIKKKTGEKMHKKFLK